MIVSKIDSITNKEWENSLSNQILTLDAFLEFLKYKCQMLEAVAPIKSWEVVQPVQTERNVATHVSIKANNCSGCN